MSKILYLDLNIRYHNPTRSLLPNLLKNVFTNVDIYGPGYSSQEDLESGVGEFCSKNGPYDFVISNEMILFALFSKYYKLESKKDFIKMYHLRFSPNLLEKKIIVDMYNFLTQTEYKKILILLQLDFYNVSKEHIALMQTLKNAYFFTFGKDVISEKSTLINIEKESFYKKINNNWYNFVNNNSNKIASFVHFIDTEDCDFTPIYNRKYTINIPGVNYWYRKEVIKNLDKKYLTPSKFHMKIYSLLAKLKLNLFKYLFANDLYNYLFRRSLAQSKIAVTCGSALKWPLRKFFEIPAEGCLLICHSFFNQEHLGFIDKSNCIVMNKPDEINNMLKCLLTNMENSENIAKKGQEMIMKNHSLIARIQQMKNVIEIIMDKNKIFNGAYWDNSSYIVYEKDNKKVNI